MDNIYITEFGLSSALRVQHLGSHTDFETVHISRSYSFLESGSSGSAPHAVMDRIHQYTSISNRERSHTSS